MSHMVATDYPPTCAVWLRGHGGLYNRVAVADGSSGKVRLYRADAAAAGAGNASLGELDLHTQPVKAMALHVAANVVVSADAKGIIEYWDAETLLMPEPPTVAFRYKTETDLYVLMKARTVPCTITMSPTGAHFAVTSRDKQLRVVDFKKGKLTRQYDESVGAYSGAGAAAASAGAQHLDTLVLGKKQAVERELEASPEAQALCNVVFDESGNFLVFGALAGVKVGPLSTHLARPYLIPI